MARSVLVPIPVDVTIGDLDRAFARDTRRNQGVGSLRRAKRSNPGGPYRVTFARAGGGYSELGRVLLQPTSDGRSLMVRSRDSAGRLYAGTLYGLAALFVSVGVAMAPLDNWHLTGPVVFVIGGVLCGAFARLMTVVNRRSEQGEAEQAAAIAFDIARQTREGGIAVDDSPKR